MKCPICNKAYQEEKIREHLQTQHKTEDIISKLIDLSESKSTNFLITAIKATNQDKKPVSIHRERFF